VAQGASSVWRRGVGGSTSAAARPVATWLLRLVTIAAREPSGFWDGHATVQTYAPGEEWFWDYAADEYVEGPA
jgi:hypothetical protein